MLANMDQSTDSDCPNIIVVSHTFFTQSKSNSQKMVLPSAPPAYEVGAELGLDAVSAAQRAAMPTVMESQQMTSQQKASLCFKDSTIRNGFVRKVFALLTVMLLIVSVMAAVPFVFPSLKDSIQDDPIPFFISLGVFVVVSILLICIERLRRNVPYNLIAMGILAVATGYMIMMICSFLDIVAVLMAFGGTTVACLLVAGFALQTKVDLYSKFGGLFVFFSLFLLAGVLFSFTALAQVPALMCLYSWLGVVLFMLFFAIDIQLVMGGHRFAIDEEEYVFAALTLFLDIINILIRLLSLVGGSGK